MYTDISGFMPKWLEVTLGIGIIIGAVALTIATAGLAAPIAAGVGGGLFGAILGGAVAGAIGGAALGFGISVGAQSISGGFNNINWADVGNATWQGAVSGFVAGGVFGGIKFAASAAKIANNFSGLGATQASMENATLVLGNTPMAIKGGVMVTERVAAQLAYNTASFGLGVAQSSYNIIRPVISLLYYGGEQGASALLGLLF